nr:carbohydrate-binding protein [Pelagicoccus albus]
MAVPRNYHSVGLLLADGTVFAGGGGYGTGDLGDQNHQDGQIFTPPNLFNADGSLAERPVISSAPEHVAVGEVFDISATPNASKFSAVRLIATTHGWSTDLRFLSLPFSEVGPGEYQVVGHPNPNVMVPGFWMIFVLDEKGVHSKAKIVHVRPNIQDNLVDSVPGLKAEYFDDILGAKKFERIDPSVNFYYGETESPDAVLLGTDGYSARWSGWVVPEVAGAYTFYTNADDGVRLRLGGESLISGWTWQSPTEYSGTIELEAGVPVPIVLEWYQGGGPCTIELRWEGPDIPKQIIPTSNLRASLAKEVDTSVNMARLGIDDKHELFFNGELIGIGTDWRETYTTELPEAESGLIAIKAINNDGPSAIVGDFTVGGERYFTNAEWKVSASYEEGWQLPGFDDSGWANATDIGDIDPVLKGIPSDTEARSIWSADTDDLEVYVRMAVGGLGVLNPGDRTYFVGQNVTLAQNVSNVSGEATFELSGLPSSFSIDPLTGVISAVPTSAEVGVYLATLTVTDDEESVSRSFTWTIATQGGLDLGFESDSDGFVYRDDMFRSTSQPEYASGSWEVDAGQEGGGLKMSVGGIDAAAIDNMSGGFETSFTLLAEREVEISFDYNLTMAYNYESDEFAQVLFALDGELFGSGEGNDYADQILDTPSETLNESTGWKRFSITLGPLAAGEHTIGLGVFNNKKTELAEASVGRFDNFNLTVITPQNMPPEFSEVSAAANTIGDSVRLVLAATDPEGGSVTYSASGLPSGLSLDANSGVISGVPSIAGEYSVVVEAIDTVGLMTSRTFSWRINSEVILAPTVSSPIVSGASAVFEVPMSGGTSPTFSWNFGDGSSDTPYSSLSQVEHVYAEPGRYLVTFTAKDSSGREISVQFYQNVAPQGLPTDKPVNSQTIAYQSLLDEADRVWMVNPDNDSVTVFDASDFSRIVEIPVGKKPRSVAVLQNGNVLVANKGSSTISELSPEFSLVRTFSLPRASQPHGLVLSPDNRVAYISLEALGFVVKMRLSDGSIIGSADVGLNARGLALDSPGNTLYVSRFITPPIDGESTLNPDPSAAGGEVLVVSIESMTVGDTILLQSSVAPDSGGGARGLPNYLSAVALSPTGLEAWVPSKQDNIQRGLLRDGLELTHDSTVRAITSRIDLLAGLETYTSRVDHDDAAVPSSAVYGPNGLYVFVALEGSREVAVIDSFGEQELFRFPVQRAPQGLCLSPDGTKLYVQNFMSRSMTVHDVSELVRRGVAGSALLATVQSVVEEALDPEVLIGKQLFYDAFDDRLSRSDYISCASCHNDGGQDGRVWDMSGFGEGLRNTIDLRGRSGDGHGLLHWSANFDEVQDFETQIRSLAEGTGLIEGGEPYAPLGAPNSGRSDDLDALAAYLISLEAFDESPYTDSDGGLTPEGLAGRAVFAAKNCAACHSGTAYSDSEFGGFHNLGTLKDGSGMRLGEALIGIDTPTLKDVWATAPYLHDGAALTLGEAIAAHAGIEINDTEMEVLVSYLRQLGGEGVQAPEPELPAIENFVTNRSVLVQGESALLSWNVTDGGTPLTGLEIDNGVGSVLGEMSFEVSPIVSTTYTLTATNLIGSVTVQLTLQVEVPQPVAPSIDSFVASSMTIEAGEGVSIDWSVADNGYSLSSLSIDQGIGSVLGLSSVEVFPEESTTYKLTATNAGGSASSQLSVVVEVAPVEEQIPFFGQAMVLPAVIQVENFDLGGEGIAYSDRDPGNNGGAYREEGPDVQWSGDKDDSYSLGWFGEGEWTEYSVEAVPGIYRLNIRVASGYSEDGVIEVSMGDRLLASFVVENTGDWQNWVTLVSPEIEITESGPEVVRIRASGAGANVNWIEFDSPDDDEPAPLQLPYSGEAIATPGLIQAEDFDLGGEEVAYSDRDASNNGGQYREEGPDIENSGDLDGTPSLGWFAGGEWTEYTIDSTPGVYSLKVRVASGYSESGEISISLGGRILGSFTVENTGGWSSWETLELEDVEITESGVQILRIEAIGAGANVNWIEFSVPGEEPATPEQSPYSGSALSISDVIQAENFDLGGQGVAYHDTDASNNGGLYREEGPDIQYSWDEDETPSLGWFSSGEWTEYSVDAAPGIYTLKVRVASGYPDIGGLKIMIGERVLTELEFGSTGGWSDWVTLLANGIEITESGLQVIRVEAIGSGANLNWIQFVAE